LFASEEIVDGATQGWISALVLPTFLTTLDGVRSRLSRRGAALNCAAHAPEIAQEESLREP
jgi:hypothetical protein